MASISVISVSRNEVSKLLTLEEGHFCDLKSIRVSPKKLSKTIASFANAEGGELFIGIEDSPRQWIGFVDQESANGHIQAFEELFPLGANYHYEFLRSDDCEGLILKVTIFKSREIAVVGDGSIYVRRSAQNLPVKEVEKIQALKRDKGLTSYESEPVNCPADVITNSEVVLRFLLEVIPTAEPTAWLKKQLILIDDKPTVAALVLFADEPQAALPKRCAVKLYRYKTSDSEGSRESLAFDPISIEGGAYTVITDAVRQTTEIVESVTVRRAAGLIQVSYPFDALHEVITNAVIHRDYSITDDIHIRIFDNRVEVLSPGMLAGHVTVENILTERFSRNPVIVRLINKFPDAPNKDVGEGLNTAFDAMRSMKLKPPVISQEGRYVKVSLKHEPLATPEESILGFLQSNASIANREARKITFIESENKVKRILQVMVKNGILEPVPGRSRYTAAYQLTASQKAGDELRVDIEKDDPDQYSLF